ncbi:TfoX N-terminal domain-containing protein [Oryzisolibacter propanilivorax]|uniref:TfoX N-terminal domain-containing protein n=1 Tax=Oryzisolibacter propanilivorax TaxID=1527607 RepID=A0A1G9PQP8_9BURK|nr:TfoX/Sxy family protein [Oryzisolibacter propanilivorax]SDM00567.1 TfoX N-terminal domain-containing protein [Oryzisolibacter propanilivorax]
MPARPLLDATLQLIDAVRAALAERLGAQDVVDERTLFGCHAFMVNGKLCLGVKGEALLVRLPPAQHASVAEQPGVRELDARGGMPGYFWIDPAGYATQAQWQHWLDAALAYNPLARATPRRRRPSLPPSSSGRGPG